MKKKLPIALTIAGSDSGGGAGIQADLKTFAALGVHGTSAITCLTAQNPKGVIGFQSCAPDMLRKQIEAVFAELPPAACKTGMLFSTELVDVVAELDGLIVDPVMIATSGAKLIDDAAIVAIKKRLLPRARLVTPNLQEAEVLVGASIKCETDLRASARRIQETFGCAALVKGGHLKGAREAIDFFYDGRTELMLTAPFIRGVSFHGTGCTYSAAITAYLAKGESLPDAVTQAKEFITQAIAQSVRAGKYDVLNSFWC
ncbi:MAG TPA: bifunctional hydroxymethylpyrimidine kinase/phosphomethylpyrimidine kinase [Verrucomicrobiae bacterium]|nr:bifunctional hydroxymethylpyrimidine kinase/phosphomethylpyrimidine kinase [Verrucomicrobiae bacterium]